MDYVLYTVYYTDYIQYVYTHTVQYILYHDEPAAPKFMARFMHGVITRTVPHTVKYCNYHRVFVYEVMQDLYHQQKDVTAQATPKGH